MSNYVFTVIFLLEMAIKVRRLPSAPPPQVFFHTVTVQPKRLLPQVVALGFCFGKQTYLQSSWNVLDGLLVFVSLVDILFSLAYSGGNRILGILRVLRLLRTLRPLRYGKRARSCRTLRVRRGVGGKEG